MVLVVIHQKEAAQSLDRPLALLDFGVSGIRSCSSSSVKDETLTFDWPDGRVQGLESVSIASMSSLQPAMPDTSVIPADL